MRKFFTKKRITFLSIICISLLILIVLLIVPIGSLSNSCLVFSIKDKRFSKSVGSDLIIEGLSSPFTLRGSHPILVWQTIVFTVVGIIFVIFLVLLLVDLKKTGYLRLAPRRPTKAERLQSQIDELQKQVDELKKGD